MVLALVFLTRLLEYAFSGVSKECFPVILLFFMKDITGTGKQSKSTDDLIVRIRIRTSVAAAGLYPRF
jgi:hypothetical protein